jgi:hypothetical protein
MYWPIEEVMDVESIMTHYGAQQPLAEVSSTSTIHGVSSLSCVPGSGIPIPTARFGNV